MLVPKYGTLPLLPAWRLRKYTSCSERDVLFWHIVREVNRKRVRILLSEWRGANKSLQSVSTLYRSVDHDEFEVHASFAKLSATNIERITRKEQ